MKEEIKKILMEQLKLCHEHSKSEPYGESLAELSRAMVDLANALNFMLYNYPGKEETHDETE